MCGIISKKNAYSFIIKYLKMEKIGKNIGKRGSNV